MTKRTALFVVVTAAAAGAIVWLLVSSGDHTAGAASATNQNATASRARDLPAVGPRHGAVGSPEYLEVAASDAHVGAAAFRAYSDDYVDSVMDQVAEHVAREKITVDETRELTYFALAAKTSIDWDAVEQVTGHGVDPNARKYATQEMF